MKSILKHGPYTYHNLFTGSWNMDFSSFKTADLAQKMVWYHSLMAFRPLIQYNEAEEFGMPWQIIYDRLLDQSNGIYSPLFSLADFGILPIFPREIFTQDRLAFTCTAVSPEKYTLTKGDLIMELDRSQEENLPVGMQMALAGNGRPDPYNKFFGRAPLEVGADVEFYWFWMQYWVESRDLYKLEDFYNSQIELLVSALIEYDLDLNQQWAADRYSWNAKLGLFGHNICWGNSTSYASANAWLETINFDQKVNDLSSMQIMKILQGFLKIIDNRAFIEQFSAGTVATLDMFAQTDYIRSWTMENEANAFTSQLSSEKYLVYLGRYKDQYVFSNLESAYRIFIDRSTLRQVYTDIDTLTIGKPILLTGTHKLLFSSKKYKERFDEDARHFYELVQEALHTVEIPLNLGVVFKAIS